MLELEIDCDQGLKISVCGVFHSSWIVLLRVEQYNADFVELQANLLNGACSEKKRLSRWRGFA
jgi:hypothetical protein